MTVAGGTDKPDLLPEHSVRRLLSFFRSIDDGDPADGTKDVLAGFDALMDAEAQTAAAQNLEENVGLSWSQEQATEQHQVGPDLTLPGRLPGGARVEVRPSRDA